MVMLTYILGEEWEFLARRTYGAEYNNLIDLFGEKISRGFDKVGIEKEPTNHKYLVRVVLHYLNLPRKAGSVEHIIEKQKLKNTARSWERAGEISLLFCGIYNSERFSYRGAIFFIEAADMLEYLYNQSERSSLDREFGEDFDAFVNVLKESDLTQTRFD